MFKVHSPYEPAGDQPKAIETLVNNLTQQKAHDQVLLGVTGSGKTFTMAKVIEATKRPTLIMAPNKILAAQLHGEMCEFFPDNAVEYFVSYYDYYQPESYIPMSDTYIEKTAKINEQIERMRHSATRAMLTRKDFIVVASVSCIYGIGEVETYGSNTFTIQAGQEICMAEIIRALTDIQYRRNDIGFWRGTFRVNGDILDIFPPHYDESAWRINFFGDEIESIWEIDVVTCEKHADLSQIEVFPNSHYITPKPKLDKIVKQIRMDLAERLQQLKAANKTLEYEKLRRRTEFDIEMLIATGSCNGIENYSRYLTGRPEGSPPPTLFEYLPKNGLLIVDESHVAIPQIYGMYRGDHARKSVLVEYGFRLPSCMDNRPLKGEEWEELRPDTIFVSATPGTYEEKFPLVVEQVVRPTGLVDPICVVKPCLHQLDDLMQEARQVIEKGFRVLVTTLTKKMAEALMDYLDEMGFRARYLHSDVKTLQRIQIIQELRNGTFDILVGINLLREGLDLPEVSLVCILDADKAGFLRSRSSLIQTIGRAARNVEGRVILYADRMTQGLEEALKETERRRALQLAHNEKHGIVPKSAIRMKPVLSKDEYMHVEEDDILKLQALMKVAAGDMDFEKAAQLRDKIRKLERLRKG